MTDINITADKYCDRDIPRLKYLGWNVESRRTGDVDYYRVVYRCSFETFYYDISNVLEPSGDAVSQVSDLTVYPNIDTYSLLIPPMTATDADGDPISGSAKWWKDINEITPYKDNGSKMMVEVQDWSNYGAWHELEIEQAAGKHGMDIHAIDWNNWSWNYFGFQTETRNDDDGDLEVEEITEGAYETYDRRMLWKIERERIYDRVALVDPPTDILQELNETQLPASMNGTGNILIGGLGETNKLYLMGEQLIPYDKFGGGYMQFKSIYQDQGVFSEETY